MVEVICSGSCDNKRDVGGSVASVGGVYVEGDGRAGCGGGEHAVSGKDMVVAEVMVLVVVMKVLWVVVLLLLVVLIVFCSGY